MNTANLRNSDINLASLEPETNTVLSSYSLPVSQSFRNWFLSHFNLDLEVNQDRSLLRLACYLLGGTGSWDSTDPDSPLEQTHTILVSQKILRDVMKPGSRDNNFNASEALAIFHKRMWSLTTETFDYTQNQARKVTSQKLPPGLRVRLRTELQHSLTDPVDLATGLALTAPVPRLAPSPIDEVEELRTDLNRLPSSSFYAISDRIPDAKAFVQRQEWPVERQLRQLTLLRQIEGDAQPRYRAVEGTTRLYTSGPTWLGLMREVRDQVTSSYWKLDLKAAQLHISAALWGWDIEPYAANGGIWAHLLREIGKNSNNQQAKGELKTFIYACVFGAEIRTLRTRAENMGHPELMTSPLIREILTARKDVEAKLLAGQPLIDAWGTEYRLTETKFRARSKQVRSIIAAVCQSYELKLLIPLIDLAKSKGLDTVAILHDCIYGTGDWEPVLNDLNAELGRVSMELLGKPVTLEATPPKPERQICKAA